MSCAACGRPILSGEATTWHTVTTTSGHVCQPVITHARCWTFNPLPGPRKVVAGESGRQYLVPTSWSESEARAVWGDE